MHASMQTIVELPEYIRKASRLLATTEEKMTYFFNSIKQGMNEAFSLLKVNVRKL